MNADRWLGLEVRHLAALQAIAAEGTFARAAAYLGYTQSAVSQQIAALERIVGARVLERPPGRRPIGLTEVGELVLRHGEAMIARVKAAQADVAALSDGAAGSLRVGTYESVGARILPAVLRQFGERWPRVEVALREAAGDAELLALVERGELELTFAMLPALEGPFEALELLRDPYVLVVPADSPLADRAGPPALAELAPLPLIGFRSCRNEQRIEAQLRARAIEPRTIFRSDHNGTVQGLVAAGVGAALVPRLTMDPTDERTVLLELDGLLPPRLLGIVWHRDRYRSPTATAFIDVARSVCAGFEAMPAAATARA
jgi:DNA-binding transcriptional LysR family regulator